MKKTIAILKKETDKWSDLIETLQDNTFEILAHIDTTTLLDAIQEHQESTKAILINIAEATPDVEDLCKNIRKLKTLKHVPIILIADEVSTELYATGLELGCIDVLSYPINPKAVIARLNQAIASWTLLQKQQKKAKNAQAVATDSMEYSNALATIVTLSNECTSIFSYEELAHAFFTFANDHNLNASIMILGHEMPLYFPSNKLANPLEREMMLISYGCSSGGEAGNRFHHFKNRLFACFKNSIVLIKNTQSTNHQLLDIIGSCMNIIDARATTLRNIAQAAIIKQQEQEKNLKTMNSAIQTIRKVFDSQTETIQEKINLIQSELSVNLAALDLGDTIELEIITLVVDNFAQVASQLEQNNGHLSHTLSSISGYLEQEIKKNSDTSP